MPGELTYNATLVDRHDLTSTLAIFTVRPDNPLDGAPPFVPGQYLTLGLNNEELPHLGSVRRPMSIASCPAEPATVEFFIRLITNTKSENPLTPLLFRMNVGDRIFLRARPAGKFTITDTVGQQWANQDIGIESNDPEPMYVAVANSAGTPAVVYHDDTDAAATDIWTHWIIPLHKFTDQGVNLTNVDSIAIGFGDKNNLQAGGSGIIFFDDIGVGRSAP